MQNDRPIEDPRTQEALALIAEVYRRYDLAGGCYVVNATECAFHYAMYTTWNATVELFAALSDITDALQAEAARLRFSPTKLALEALVARLDGLIDQVMDEAVRERHGGEAVRAPAQHTYPPQYAPGRSWVWDEAWGILDTLTPGTLPEDIRILLAGMIAGTLMRLSGQQDATPAREREEG
jgi:hypothetical protein